MLRQSKTKELVNKGIIRTASGQIKNGAGSPGSGLRNLADPLGLNPYSNKDVINFINKNYGPAAALASGLGIQPEFILGVAYDESHALQPHGSGCTGFVRPVRLSCRPRFCAQDISPRVGDLISLMLRALGMMGKALLRWCWLAILVSVLPFERIAAQDAPQSGLALGTTRAVGTVISISGQSLTLKTDAGAEITVVVADSTKLLQLKPSQKDLKDAAPLALADIKAADRILVRGAASADGKQIQATSIVAMKQTDIADKQARDRAEWQRNGVGGLVKSVEPATGIISITANGVGTAKEISIRTSKSTVLRRYAADSVKFDDAKPAPITEIKPGDQLRARGQKSAEGKEITADEIVSGTFRSIAGILVSTDAAAGTITVTDLATKRPLTLRVRADSQLRKLQPFMAQGIAMRLKAAAADAPGGPGGSPSVSNGAPGPPSFSRPGPSAAPSRGAPAAGMPPGAGGPASVGPGGGMAGANGQARGGGEFQQMIARMPAASLSDLAKGDALMIVATEGSAATPSTIITLLGGVEPILQASSKATPEMILSPWSLGAGGGGEGATP